MSTLCKIARRARALFDDLAVKAAQSSNVIPRRRVFTPAGLVATFVLGFLKTPNPSAEDLAQMAGTLGEPVTPQAIHRGIAP